MSKIDFELIDIPIEYKQINPSDFDQDYYKVSDKRELELDENGYLSGNFAKTFKDSYDTKSTVVINAGVGQGKSTGIIKLIDNYLKFDEYVIVLAVPFKSLINQYFADCLKNTRAEKEQIFNYLKLDSYYFDSTNYYSTIEELWGTYVSDEEIIRQNDLSSYRLHITTINGILGNSGDDFIFQTKKKDDYFKALRNHCNVNNKKMILIFDEIHAGIHNFKEEYIFNLWNYKNFIQKIFLASATYNEASKEVIKYLAELTENKIDIFETKRLPIAKKQSKLNLIFNYKNNISENEDLCELLSNLITKGKEFDIITYSAYLADEIANKAKAIAKGNRKINVCHSKVKQTKENPGRIKHNMINIGTNFSTGVSIEKKAHNLIICLPNRNENVFQNTRGIFTGGQSSIIQALARQREVGKIWIVMPPPKNIHFSNSTYTEDIRKKFEAIFLKFNLSDRNIIAYTNINSEHNKLNQLYLDYSGRVSQAINNINKYRSKTNNNRLLFPTKEIFILEKGEYELSKSFFEGDLSTYVFWAAISNQFLNCKLNLIKSKNNIEFESNDFNKEVLNLYKNYIDNAPYEEIDGEKSIFISDYTIFYDLREEILKSDIIANGDLINDKQKKELQIILLEIVLNKGSIGNNYVASENSSRDNTLQAYIKSNIYFSQFVDNEQIKTASSKINEKVINSMGFYRIWSEFKLVFENYLTNSKNKNIINSNPFKEFVELYNNLKMEEILINLIENDIVLGLFPKKGTIKKYRKENNSQGILNVFYDLSISILYNYEYKLVEIEDEEERKRHYVIKSKKSTNNVNLLYNNLDLPEITL